MLQYSYLNNSYLKKQKTLNGFIKFFDQIEIEMCMNSGRWMRFSYDFVR